MRISVMRFKNGRLRFVANDWYTDGSISEHGSKKRVLMLKAILGLLIATMIVLVSSACSKNGYKISEQQASGETARKAMVSPLRHCFRNEYPIDDTKDMEELVIVVDGEHAIGEYNWIPAYKDKRLGRFNGSIQNNTISANYVFEQEGQSDTTTILIFIKEEQAVVEGGVPELGLNLTLARVEC